MPPDVSPEAFMKLTSSLRLNLVSCSAARHVAASTPALAAWGEFRSVFGGANTNRLTWLLFDRLPMYFAQELADGADDRTIIARAIGLLVDCRVGLVWIIGLLTHCHVSNIRCRSVDLLKWNQDEDARL